MMEKTQISSVLYKGRLIRFGSHKKKALENCSTDFKLKASIFAVKILHVICSTFYFKTKKSVLNKNTVAIASL